MSETLKGLVVYKSSRNIRVRLESSEVLLCSLRGKFRRDDERLPVVGDQVIVSRVSSGEGVLEETSPRRNELRRAKSLSGRGRRGVKEKIIAANMDQVLIVMACSSPPPRWGLVDRVLVSASYEELDAGICLNKWDQIAEDSGARAEIDRALGVYESLGYRVFRTSILHGEGREELSSWLEGKFTVLSGHSGVGKSTLLNCFAPEEAVPTGAISESTGKGKHVTTAATLYDIQEFGGYLVDTPGYREYGLLDLGPSQLALYFREFVTHVSDCRFKDCQHTDEPGCGVQAARERGDITEFRYGNYLQILKSLR